MPLILATALLACFPQSGPTAPQAPTSPASRAPSPYDMGATTALLDGQLANLGDSVAVLVHQNGREIYRFQHGSIDFDTQTRMASLTKSISAGVILDSIEEGLLSLDETLGEAYPIRFGMRGLGNPTVLDCWSMRHGIDAPLAYEHLSLFTHAQSVAKIAQRGYVTFPAGDRLAYDGKGMQVTGLMAAERSGLSWEDLTQARILDPLGMNDTDYGQFSPNPCVPGGMRSTALDVMRYAQMILNEGAFRGQQILEPASIECFFTNHTRSLPVEHSPFPAQDPGYPYGARPDYGFGGWILAEHPASQHIEEVIGAGAWGSYVWMDRRRNLTGVLVTDIPAGTQSSGPAALGLFAIARDSVEALQVRDLAAQPNGSTVQLSWTLPPGARAARLVGSSQPILDIFDLRAATPIATARGTTRTVPTFAYYAATALLDHHQSGAHHNEALIPGENSIPRQ